MSKLTKSTNKSNLETARRSERLKTKVLFPSNVSPQKSIIMKPVPLPLVKLEVKSEPTDEESTSFCCSPVAKPGTSEGPFITTMNCYLCPALLVYNEATGVAYHLGDNGCIFASPTNFTEEECKTSNTTENAPIEKIEPLISSYSPAKLTSKKINAATRKPKINLGDKKRRASASPSRESENRQTEKIPRVDGPTNDGSCLLRPVKLCFTTTNRTSSNPPKKCKLLHPWTCRVCQTLYWKQRDYMYHSCGSVPKVVIKRPLDEVSQKWTKR